MMNVSKYTPSGSTQRNGIAAISRQSLLVVATNSTEATAGNATQRKRARDDGAASGLMFVLRTSAVDSPRGALPSLSGRMFVIRTFAARRVCQAQTAQRPAKRTSPADQPRAR